MGALDTIKSSMPVQSICIMTLCEAGEGLERKISRRRTGRKLTLAITVPYELHILTIGRDALYLDALSSSQLNRSTKCEEAKKRKSKSVMGMRSR
jgi:hypothetical protein